MEFSSNVGAEISRSLLVTGREFSWPIDFNTNKHISLTPSAKAVVTYAQEQAHLLQCNCQVARVLIEEHRAYHRERINSLRPDPRLYEPGDNVFARVAVKSDRKKGRVAKVSQAYNGPWKVIKKLVFKTASFL